MRQPNAHERVAQYHFIRFSGICCETREYFQLVNILVHCYFIELVIYGFVKKRFHSLFFIFEKLHLHLHVNFSSMSSTVFDVLIF